MAYDPTVKGNIVYKPITLGAGKYRYNTFSAMYSFGKQRVFWDKIILDYGIKTGFNFTGAFNALFYDNYYFDSSTMEESLSVLSKIRMFQYQLINFHFGIGFLAF